MSSRLIDTFEPRTHFTVTLTGGDNPVVTGRVNGLEQPQLSFKLSGPADGRFLISKTGGTGSGAGLTYDGHNAAAVSFDRAAGTFNVTARQSPAKAGKYVDYAVAPYVDYVGDAKTAANNLGTYAGSIGTVIDHVGNAPGGFDNRDWFRFKSTKSQKITVSLKASATASRNAFSSKGVLITLSTVKDSKLNLNPIKTATATGGGTVFTFTIPAGDIFLDLYNSGGIEPNYALRIDKAASKAVEPAVAVASAATDVAPLAPAATAWLSSAGTSAEDADLLA